MDYEEMKPIGLVRLMLTDGVITQEQAAKYFPELAESEDERIRKALMQNLKERFGTKGNMGEGLDMPDVLAWLKKQGEQKPVVDDKDAEKASEEYRNFRMSCGIKDPVMLNEIEEAYYEGAIRKQKPAWSEEDEDILNTIINHFKVDIECTDEDDMVRWLKSLKDRVQPKREWSEEDEKMIQDIINDIAIAQEQVYCKSRCEDEINWLKSLRPQNRWKPSDEQMKALKEAVDEHFDIDGGALWHLYQELKNLKE